MGFQVVVMFVDSFMDDVTYVNNVLSPVPPQVLMNFRGFPPGCGDSVADF